MSSKACRRSFHVGDLRRADSDSDSESDLRSLNSTASLSNQLDSVPGENKESSIQESGPAKITIEDQIREYRAAKLKREITALLAWANTFLKARGFEAKDVSTDFKDGVLLINLLEATFREKVVAMYNLRPKLQAHRLDNYTHIFEFLKKNKVNTLSVDMHDMVNGKESQTVSLLWNILRRLTLKGLAALNNLDEGSIMNENASGKSAMGVKSMLKQWVNEVLSNHEEVSDVQVTDFWNSFKSGKAFAAIIGELAPGKIDLSTVDSKSAPELLREAFRIAEEELGIPSLLSPEDLLTMTDSDEKAVENYLCMLISAQNAMKQKKVEVQKIQRKLSTIEKEKDLELQKLQKNIEEEKKQFNMLQEDVQKLQDMYNSAFNSEQELKDKIKNAEEEKQSFLNNLKELQDEIGRTHKQLLDAMDREKKSNEANSQLLKEISSMRSELESSREENVRLNADLYKSYREYEDILNSYRSEMKEKVMDSKNSAEDQFGELVENSILEQKGITDFMNSLPNREGWLSKMKKTGTFKSAYKPVRRYFAIRGDTLYYSKKKIGSSTNLPNIHSVKLKYFKMINIGLQGPLEENTADIRRHSMLSTKTSIEIYPDESKKNNPAKKLILGPILVLGELPQDVYDWAQDINDRIALISYLTSMEEKAKLTGRTQGCREIVNYICERSSSLLKIENKVPIDLFNALVHFKQSLMSRKGLSIYLSNAGIPDSVCEILAEIVEQNYTMRAMVLSKNLISDEGVERLAKAIKANLQFSAIDLEKNNIGDSGISALGEAIETHRMISRINLSYNAITDAGIKKFAQSMIRNVETHKNVLDFPVLELDGNKIGDEGAIAIAKLCKINQAITSVQLNKNMITDTGAMALAEAIQNGSGITDLQLADNQVSSKGASAIAQAIYKCGRAVTVDLSFNKLIGRKGFSAYFGVETPISMEKFKITMNTVDQELGRK